MYQELRPDQQRQQADGKYHAPNCGRGRGGALQHQQADGAASDSWQSVSVPLPRFPQVPPEAFGWMLKTKGFATHFLSTLM